MRELYRFSEDNDSCVIQNPKTPRHWYNYLWNENGYCAQVSQMCIQGGIPEITVDGGQIDGSLLPDFRDGENHEIQVFLRQVGARGDGCPAAFDAFQESRLR